jgi:hypothetical protein
MSRLTGTDAYGLMEAYNAVYAPQELTEEQVWEEVENWVNSLLEEGYDLSDYTWEEMYEEYLTERGFDPAVRGSTTKGAVTTYGANDPRRSSTSYTSPFARPMNAGTPQTFGGGRSPVRTVRPQIGSLPTNYRGAELQQTAAARASQSGTSRQGTAGGPAVGGNTPIGPSPTRTPTPPTRTPTPPTRTPTPPTRTPTPPVRTNTPPVRTNTPPVRTATPPGGTTKPTAPATTTPSPSAPRPKDTSITDMIGRSQVRQGAAVNTGNTSSDTRAIALRSSVGATPKPATSTATARPTPRQARLNMEMEYDTFDTVLEYLVSEGYADTEESALVIMANMSEEWKQSIVG